MSKSPRSRLTKPTRSSIGARKRLSLVRRGSFEARFIGGGQAAGAAGMTRLGGGGGAQGTLRLRFRAPTARCASAYTVYAPHHAGIGTRRSSCSRSNVRPESDRRAMGCYTIRAYRRGRTCPGAAIGMRSGRKLATLVRSRRDKLGLSPRGPTRGASGSRGDNFRAWQSTICYPRRYPA
jgi:hypothetical protein